ncbi:MAG TPA: hypothetical protein VHB51_00100 [Candidatus Saccharimonadales bacterium]|nr:hypothetical protein [Candidatus Saccharimonadales bacterium]
MTGDLAPRMDLMAGSQPWILDQIPTSTRENGPTRAAALVFAAAALALVMEGGPGVPAPRVGTHSSEVHSNAVFQPARLPKPREPKVQKSFSVTHR